MKNFISRLGREVDFSKPVRVYRNLNNGLVSIKQKNLVVGYAEEIIIKKCEYPVNENLRQKVLKEQSKKVHAYVYGFVEDEGNLPKDFFADAERADYNPYKYDSFILVKNGGKLAESNYCFVNSEGLMLVK